MITMSFAFRTSLRLWTRTIIFNALIFGFYSICDFGFAGVLVIVVTLIGGFLLTFPLVLLVNPIVKAVARIPYNLNGRLASLSVLLMLLAFSFEALVAWKFGVDIFTDEDFLPFLVSTGLSIAIASWSLRNSLHQAKICGNG